MATTEIKRLYQNSKEFVPITLAEAVVVNTEGTNLQNIGITTLDDILRRVLGIIGDNNTDIDTLEQTLDAINKALSNKQDKLTPGTGISIDSNGVISATSSVEIYKVAQSLPQASKECLNIIYLIPNSNVQGNIAKEYICIEQNGIYQWEELGSVTSNVNLEGYVDKTTFNTTINEIRNLINGISGITAENIKTSGGVNIVVNYTIPENLYDSLINN